MRYAAAIPACALLAGTAAGVCLHVPPRIWSLPLVFGWIGLLLLLLRARGPTAARAALAAACAGFFGGGATLGAIDASRARRPPLIELLAREGQDPTACGGVRELRAGALRTGAATRAPRTGAEECTVTIEVEGRLKDDAASGQFGVTFTLAVTQLFLHGPRAARAVPVDGTIRVSVGGARARERLPAWRAGRLIRAPIAVRAPLPYRNFGLPDQRERLALAGLTLFGSIKSASLVQPKAKGRWWRERAAALRAWVRQRVIRHVGESPAAAIVTAVLIGDRAALPQADEQRLQRAGTYHVIAISGGNIALLTGVVLMLLRLLRVPPRPAACLAGLLIALYALVIDAGPSVVRSTMAAVGYLGARAVDLEARSLNILAAVVSAILIVSPLTIVDTAFWLTCGATLGILIHAAPTLQRWRAARGEDGDASRQIAPAFSRSGGLTSGGDRVRTGLTALGWKVMWLVSALMLTTLAAEVVLLPIAARAFSQVTFAGLFLNLLAIPLMSLVQLAALAMLACAALADTCAAMAGGLTMPAGVAGAATAAIAADAAGASAQAAAALLLRSADFVHVAPWLARRVAPPSMWLVVAYFMAWTGIWLAPAIATPAGLRRRLRQSMALGWALCLGLIVCSPRLPSLTRSAVASSSAPAPDTPSCEPEEIPAEWQARPWLRLTMLDVGQGAATLLESPDSTLLIDTGGTASPSFDIGARIVSPALWALGLRRLSALAITHGDIDHAGGAPTVLQDFTPSAVWTSSVRPPPAVGAAAMHEATASLDPIDPRLQALAALARAHGIPWRTLAAGESRTLGAMTMQVVNPWPAARSGTYTRAARLRNDDSLVLTIGLGDVSIVLPGDIGAAVERRIARHLSRAPLVVLVAPHHGSASSSSPALLDALTPRIALISAGLGNRHGHPAPAALARYRARGTALFRTDHDGAIQVVTDGRTLRLRTCGGRALHTSTRPVPRL